MKVVHISATPLAGSPIRIVNALNKYTDVQARSINLDAKAYGVLTFPEDLLWNENREECEDLIRQADILHFHHWFDFSSKENPFKFDFISAMKKGARYLIHWHSNPMTISSLVGQSVDSIVNSEIPQMVVAQFHESYYPNAFPVPLIVEVKSLSPKLVQAEKPVVFFSPSSKRHAYEERWETKGKPEIVKLLNDLKMERKLDYKLVENIPFDECNKMRAECDIVIDDMVTGGFHTTSLESMALGKPTFSYMDARTQMVLSQLTNTTDCPLINVRYLDAKSILRELAENRQLRTDLGQFSRDWMLKYYSEEKMVACYKRAYSNLLEKGGLYNERYHDNRQAKIWLYTKVPDLIWQERRNKEIGSARIWINFLKYKSLKSGIIRKFPHLRSRVRKIKNIFLDLIRI